ncbi:MAG: type II toxin-antitoxin system Phd/YefM family antitoxin [Chitinivibrionia bacterium]|jgi:PHD/YefM family antitoxin component YafN of YafNO toxin-antitoxin module|nr:type II toxin-antitoxin system Phd/YefM family antitoxin [Chitinivibrionia bacterium]
MQTMTATSVKKNFDEILENIQNDNEPIFVVGNEKAMVMISAEYWRSFEETAYLSQSPKMRKKILKGLETPVSKCIPESEINF